MPLDSPYSTKARTFGVIFPRLSRPVTESAVVRSEKTIRISERTGGKKAKAGTAAGHELGHRVILTCG